MDDMDFDLYLNFEVVSMYSAAIVCCWKKRSTILERTWKHVYATSNPMKMSFLLLILGMQNLVGVELGCHS